MFLGPTDQQREWLLINEVLAEYISSCRSDSIQLLLNLNCTDNYDVVEIKLKSVTDHHRVPKMCEILKLVSAPSNPRPIVDHFRRSHPVCEHSY